MRISSLKTQHRIFVVGEDLLDGETPDRLSLYLPDGTPIDLDADPNKMTWRGAWDVDETYSNESVVTFDDTLWVAIQDVLAGVTPGTDPAMWEVMVGEVEPELPPGGADGYFLAKASADDGDVAWVNASSLIPANELPPGGATGYILAKASETDGDVYWIPAPSGGGGGGSGLPPGGTYAMLLAKASSVDGDAVWIMPPLELPAGGPSGYILRKASSADGHVSWVSPSVGVPNELPPSGATGYLLAKGSEETGDVIWIEPPSGALPAGGTTSQVLAKNSSTDGDAGWVAPTPRDMPIGGSTGQVLAKTSGADRVTGWVAPTPRDVPVGGSTGQVLTKNSSTDRDTGWATPSSGGGGGSSDPSVVIDDTFDGSMAPWTADVGSFTQDSANGYLTPGAIGSILRYNVATFLDALVAVEFEVLAGFTAGSGIISPQVRRNTTGTHAVHVNLTTAGQGVLYKLHTSSYTSITSPFGFNAGAALAAGKRYFAACWAYGYWVGMRAAQHPLAIPRPINCDTINDLSGDANFNPDAAGRVAIVAEQTQMRIHRVTIYDLTKTRSHG